MAEVAEVVEVDGVTAMRVSLGSAILWGLLIWQSAWAAPAAELKMVYFDDFAPYSWRDEQGKMRGLMIDVMDRMAAQMGLRVAHEGYPWQRAQKMVRLAQADGFVTIANSERRSYTLVVEEPVTTTTLTIFTPRAHSHMQEFLQAKRLGDLKAFKEGYRRRLDAAAWSSDERERIVDEVLEAYRHNTAVLEGLSG